MQSNHSRAQRYQIIDPDGTVTEGEWAPPSTPCARWAWRILNTAGADRRVVLTDGEFMALMRDLAFEPESFSTYPVWTAPESRAPSAVYPGEPDAVLVAEWLGCAIYVQSPDLGKPVSA